MPGYRTRNNAGRRLASHQTLTSGAPPVDLPDDFQQLKQTCRVLWSTADIEGSAAESASVLSCARSMASTKSSTKSTSSNLHPIPVQSDLLACDGFDQEMRHPALIFCSALVRPIDATHAKDNVRHAVAASVIEHVLVRRAF